MRRKSDSPESSIFDLISDPGYVQKRKKTEARQKKAAARKKILAPYRPGSATDTSNVDKWGKPKLLQFVRSLGPIYGVSIWMDSQMILVNTQKPPFARQAEFNQFLDVLGEIGKTNDIPQYAMFFDRWFANWEAQVIAFPGLANAVRIGFQPKYWMKVFGSEGRQSTCFGTEIYNWVISQEEASQVIKNPIPIEVEDSPEPKAPFQMGNLDFLLD
jgi:hypothetical protein